MVEMYECLKVAREYLCLSEKYVAGMLNISQSELHDIESGKTEPTEFQLDCFYKLYGISMEEMGNGNEPAPMDMVNGSANLPDEDRERLMNLLRFQRKCC